MFTNKAIKYGSCLKIHIRTFIYSYLNEVDFGDGTWWIYPQFKLTHNYFCSGSLVAKWNRAIWPTKMVFLQLLLLNAAPVSAGSHLQQLVWVDARTSLSCWKRYPVETGPASNRINIKKRREIIMAIYTLVLNGRFSLSFISPGEGLDKARFVIPVLVIDL
jgi:hypothetical protein